MKQLPEELIRFRPVLCTQIAWGFMDVSEMDASEARLRMLNDVWKVRPMVWLS